MHDVIPEKIKVVKHLNFDIFVGFVTVYPLVISLKGSQARAEPVAGFIVAARISPNSARALGIKNKQMFKSIWCSVCVFLARAELEAGFIVAALVTQFSTGPWHN